MSSVVVYVGADDPFWGPLCSSDIMDGLSYALEGELGSGKTSLVRHFLRYMGVSGSVKSPSYTLCTSYDIEGRRSVLHRDAYRKGEASDWALSGLEYYNSGDYTHFIEWCSMDKDMYEACDVIITIQSCEHDNTRCYTLCSQSLRGEIWVERARALNDQGTV